MPTINVTPGILVDRSELAFSFARAGGSGGQRERTLKVAGASRFSGDCACKRRDAVPPSQEALKHYPDRSLITRHHAAMNLRT